LEKWCFLLDDQKEPYLKKWSFRNQPIKNGGWTSRDSPCFFLHHPSGVFVAEEVRQMTTWEAGEPHREPANGQSV